MDYIDESDVVIHCEAYTAMYLRENSENLREISPSNLHQ